MAACTASRCSLAKPSRSAAGRSPLLAPCTKSYGSASARCASWLQRCKVAGISRLCRRDAASRKRARVAVAAEKDKIDEELSRLTDKLPTEKLPAPEKLPGEGKAKDEDKSLAIVTGAISIAIGVLYLVGVTFLNSRGNKLEPPPPEAFGWLNLGLRMFS